MKQTYFLLILATVFSLSACSQPGKNAAPVNKPDPKDLSTGASCEGCEAIYESPVPFDQLKDEVWLPDWKEKGTQIEISGVVYKPDGMPAPGVIIYIYHTDQTGRYTANKSETGWGKRHGSVRAWMKTNERGEYKFFTLRPMPYPGTNFAAHIHITIKEPGMKEYWIDEYVFDDDPFVTAAERSRLEDRGGSGILPIPDDYKGAKSLKSTRNIYLGKNVPGYPTQKTRSESNTRNSAAAIREEFYLSQNSALTL